jgi:hypothetical protein
MSLLLHELLHLTVGTVLGLVIKIVTQKPGVLHATVISSLLIDIDHLVDYLSTVGPAFDADALVTGSYFVSSGHVIVLLHSWELTAVLLALGIFIRKKYSGIVLGVGVGLLGHLVIDQFWYAQPWSIYFLTLRWLHNFVDPRLW